MDTQYRYRTSYQMSSTEDTLAVHEPNDETLGAINEALYHPEKMKSFDNIVDLFKSLEEE